MEEDSYSLLGVWGTLCKCLGPEASPYVDILMPSLLQALEKQVSKHPCVQGCKQGLYAVSDDFDVTD